MKKNLISSAILLILALQTPIFACGVDRIGFYAHESGWGCSVGAPLYVLTTIHFLLISPEIEWVREASFRVANFPRDEGYPTGMITEYWNGIASGNLNDGLTLKFDPDLSANIFGIFELGTVDIIAFDDEWVGYGIECEFTDISILDSFGQSSSPPSANSNFYYMCVCDHIAPQWENCLDIRHFLPWSGQQVEAEFNLNFDVQSTLDGSAGVSFSGIILLDEIPVEEFGYTESRHFSIPISTNAYAPGDEITVEIQVHRSEPYEMEDSETLTYIVGDGSPVFDDTNWGSLKSAY